MTKYKIIVTTDDEQECRIIANAKKTYFELHEWDSALRSMWKHDNTLDEDTIHKVWDLWSEHKPEIIGE